MIINCILLVDISCITCYTLGMKQQQLTKTKELNVTKLQKLHDRFEALSFYIENTEDQINKRIDEGLSTSSLDRHLERLQDEEYKIQCKIEKLEGGVA